jgi:hypothetical protein
MTALKAFFDEYTPRGKILLICAIVALAIDAAISWQYGITQTRMHAAGFAMVAILFAILPEHAYDAFARGYKKMGWGLVLLCLPVGSAAYYTHLGYGSSIRVGNVSEAKVQNVKYTDARDQVVDNKANLEMWKTQLAKLKTENAWSAAVTADGLRARLPALELAIAQEAKRKGCGPICLARTKERDEVQSQIATTEAMSDLTRRIEATQKLVDKYREQSAQTKHQESPIHNQIAAGAKIWNMVSGGSAGDIVNPDDVTVAIADIGITANGSFAFMLMAPGFFLLASMYRRREEEQSSRAPTNPVAFNPLTSVPSVPPVEHRFAPPPQTVIQRMEGFIASRGVNGESVLRQVQPA